MALLGCGTLTLLPRPSSDSPSSSQLRSLQDLATAYIRVQPGETRASQLAALGFDTTTANVQVLSYLGVMERFAGDSRKFDRMDAALQECIEARDRCTALVFKPGDQRSGSGMFASFGLGSANAATREAAVTLLVQDGRVAYKAISGVPQTMLAQREPAPAPIERPRTAAIPVSARTVY
ncbi:MAG: hypothetical protein WDM86_21705 [Rhizomicrobium sp.]